MSATKQVVIIGAGPGGLAGAMLLAGRRVSGQVAGAPRPRRRPDLGHRGATASASTWGRRSSSTRASWKRSSRRRPRPSRRGRAGPARSAVSPGLRRRRRAEGDRRRRPHAAGHRRPLAARRRRSSPGSWPRTGSRWTSSGRSSSRRSWAGHDLLKPHLAQAPADAPPVPLARPRARALLPRPAGPAGDDVPVEIPGDVAVPVPEPVLDPVVPRIRVRRLPPDRRLRGGHRIHGRDRPRPGRRDLARRRGARRSTSRAASGRRPVAVGLPRLRRPGHQRRLRPGDDPARARPASAGAGPTGRSPARSSPARRSCSTWASRADSTTWPITRSTWPRTTCATSTRSRTGTSSRPTRRSTSRTPA